MTGGSKILVNDSEYPVDDIKFEVILLAVRGGVTPGTAQVAAHGRAYEIGLRGRESLVKKLLADHVPLHELIDHQALGKLPPHVRSGFTNRSPQQLNCGVLFINHPVQSLTKRPGIIGGGQFHQEPYETAKILVRHLPHQGQDLARRLLCCELPYCHGYSSPPSSFFGRPTAFADAAAYIPCNSLVEA